MRTNPAISLAKDGFSAGVGLGWDWLSFGCLDCLERCSLFSVPGVTYAQVSYFLCHSVVLGDRAGAIQYDVSFSSVFGCCLLPFCSD
jgi:hypothetical protein